jgi:threonine 3-dehydrogenase
MRKMKALVKKYDKKGLWLDEVPVPIPGINDVLIKIKKTSICGTDVHIYKWDEWAQSTIKIPTVIGHEYVGTVEAVGSNVHDFYKGELVSGEGHLVCGHCRNCLAGRRHLCMKSRGVGVNRDGAFAEYLCIPAGNVWVCDPKIPEEVLSIFDPFGNAVHTALSYDLLGEDVLITGAGPIGIMAIAVAKHAGARFVVITDINPARLELAAKMGATRVVDVRKEKLDDVMNDLGMKEGFDVGLEMSGSKDALNDMLPTICHGGKIALLGILDRDTHINWDLVVFNGLTIKGIYGRQMFETWYKMTVMIQTGLDITPVITHQFDYTDFEKGFELMGSGNSGKIILDWKNV